jgi:NAD(P)H-hydrate epimerase
MKLVTREQIAEIDRIAETSYGFSKEQLVEKAGKSLAAKFQILATDFQVTPASRIGIWCGPGNNGADGRAMGRILANSGFKVRILEGVAWSPQDFDVLIDAFFGVGLNRDLSEDLVQKIREIEVSAVKVFSVDIPSGLCANTGQVRGASVKAAVTLTIYPPKPGLFLNQGPAQCGRLYCVSLELPAEIFTKPDFLDTFLVDRKMARRLLPRRKATGNKTGFGHLLVIAGSPGMEGAASMVCEAAARMGCGYVTLCSRSPHIAQFVKPDYLQLSLQDLFKSDLKKYQAVVLGPGLGLKDESLQLLQHVLKHHPKVLVDADGLTLLAKQVSAPLPSGWILTPHAGELSRLTGIPAAELEADRLSAVSQGIKKWKAVILFKGFRTVLRTLRQQFVIYSGNVALAKAGSGDVLAGFVGSLMAQGLASDEAGALGAYLHGRIADDWVRQGGSTRSLMASDLPGRIDATLRSLKKTR